MKYQFKEILYLCFHRLPNLLIGKYLKHNLIYVHWGRGLNNFGDCLTPYILKYYGLTPVYVPNANKSDIILAGTILQWITQDYCGFIVGTGGDNQQYNFPKAQILAVRGKLTRQNIRNAKHVIQLGDPGLLMPYVFPPENKCAKYNLGIIPHFVDKNEDFIKKWKKRFKNENVIFIDVLDSPKNVIYKIQQCEYIASSSLHGLIIADAYHIPNIRFVSRKTMPDSFYDFKFDDYYSSIGTQCDYIEVTGDETIDFLIQSSTVKSIETIDSLKKNLNTIMNNVCINFKKA